MQELGRVDQQGYSVQLVRDGCGGAVVGFVIFLDQRMSLLPGLYLKRSLDAFDGAYEGKLTVAGPNEIRVQIPKGVDGSGWHREVDHIYQVKPHVYF